MEHDPIDVILRQWRRERPDVDPSPLAIVSRILMLFRELEHSADQALAPHELTLRQFDVLSALRRSGKPFCLTPTQLVRMVTLSSGAMTNRLDRLESLGYVTREPDPDDRRGVRIRLTAAGRRAVDQAVSVRLDEARSHLRIFTMRERRVIEGLLRRLLVDVRRRNARPDTHDGDRRAKPRRAAATSVAARS